MTGPSFPSQSPKPIQDRESAPAAGAMTRAMRAVRLPTTGERALRIGVLEDGAIRDERVHQTAVSVGRDEAATIVIRSNDAPGRFQMFRRSPSGWVLRFPEHARGRVASAVETLELAQLVSTGRARAADGVFEVELPGDARGKIVMGQTTLLFQLVVPPPARTRPALPASVRNGFIRNVDWVFTSFVLASFMVHFGVVTFLEGADSPIGTITTELPPQVADLIFNDVPPPPPDSDDPPVDPNATPSTPTTPTGAVARNDHNPRNDNPRPRNDTPLSDEDRARIAQDAMASAANLLLIGTPGQDRGNAIDLLINGAPIANASDVMAQVNSVQVASRDDLLRPHIGNTTTRITGPLFTLNQTTGPNGPIGEPTTVVERRVPRIPFDPRDFECDDCDGTFDDAVIQRALRTRIRAIQACYEHRLRLNPTLNGKVAVAFTIEQVGSVSHVTITENTTGDSGMSECVAAPLRTLRFNPGPVGGSVSVAYPFIFARQN